jgi:hypothetical protein
MYLLPWALQEEVLRNPSLTGEERLEKATLSFLLFYHYFKLSSLPCEAGVSKRFCKIANRALIFANDCSWLRVLNAAVMLIQFIEQGDETWSFSRLGTHCLDISLVWSERVLVEMIGTPVPSGSFDRQR